jgi:RimJ/RimL family protein N-acetyltransferase
MVTSLIKLETFSEVHCEETFKWMQIDELRRDFLFKNKITQESHKIWYNNYLKDNTQEIFAIFQEEKYVGNIGLKNIINFSAETWVYIGDKNQKNKGVAFFSYLILLDSLKKSAKFKNLYCFIASFNIASQRLYEKLNFQHIQDQDKFIDNEDYILKKYDLII